MNHLDLNTSAAHAELTGHEAPVRDLPEMPSTPLVSTDLDPEAKLGVWLRALLSYFDAGNHPFAETEHADLTKHDFAHEIRIARTVMSDCSRLAFQLASAENVNGELFADGSGQSPQQGLSLADDSADSKMLSSDQPLLRLAEGLGNFCLLCEELLTAGVVKFSVWSNIGKLLARDFGHSEPEGHFIHHGTTPMGANLPPRLVSLTREALLHRSFGADLAEIFSRLIQMLGWLAQVESYLQRDAPLKQTLPIFTLINQETRDLRRFVENRTLRLEGLEPSISDVLDGTNYALAMELRKVFSRELIGLSALRHPPTIYSKVETAHGILRDSFQQSIVAVAQLSDPTLDGTLLFEAYQTRKQQSMILRRDLWMLLQLIQRAEKERDQHPLVRLLERLVDFQEGSLRHLMYKDWEASERFIEEVGAARGAVELAPVLHRFAAFVETLFGQVSLRAVLADSPFDFPALAN